jgi:hypothetical protein
MAFPDSFSPPGEATASRFDRVAGDFTGMPRDLPGPQERGPAPSFWPPAAGGPATPPREAPEAEGHQTEALNESAANPEWPGTHGGGLPDDWQTGSDIPPPSVLPAETALSLQQWSAALVGAAAAENGPVPPVRPSAVAGQGVSLAALAEHLRARLVHGDPESPGEIDFWQPDPQPADLGAHSNSLLDGMDWDTIGPRNAEPSGHDTTGRPTPSAAPVAAQSGRREGEGSPLAAVSSPAGIRAAAGLLAQPPKSPAEPRQGDVFFLNHPAAAPPPAVASGMEPEDFLCVPTTLTPMPSPNTPKAMALAGPAGRMESLPDRWGSPHPAEIAEAPASLRPPPLPSLHPTLPTATTPPDPGGTGLVIGGTGLVLLGIYLACRLPLIWLDYRASADWPRQLAASSLLMHAGGSVVALLAGVGSIYLQRWAVTLVLAAGWLSVFTAALLIGIAAFLLGSDTPVHFPPASAVLLLGGLLVPLAYLLYYEKLLPGPSPGRPVPADGLGRSVPLLMLVLTGLALAVGAAAMLQHAPALPWPDGRVITGPPAQAAWTALLVAGAISAFFAWHRQPVAWWLLFLVTAGLCATISVSSLSGTPSWESFLTALGRPEGAGLSDPYWRVTAGLSPLIPALVLLMTRRSLPSSPPP